MSDNLQQQEVITHGTIHISGFQFSQDQVNAFAALTGDNNPIHWDNEYTANTMFKRPIIHGFLVGSIFSREFGMVVPGEGTIYVKQDMNFKRPMYVDTHYEAVFEFEHIDYEKAMATVKTSIRHAESGKVCMDGVAVVMNNRVFKKP